MVLSGVASAPERSDEWEKNNTLTVLKRVVEHDENSESRLRPSSGHTETLDAGRYRGIYYRYPSCHTEAYRSPTMCNIPASRVILSLLNCFFLIKMDEAACAEAARRVGNLGRFPRLHFLSLFPFLHSLMKASVLITHFHPEVSSGCSLMRQLLLWRFI